MKFRLLNTIIIISISLLSTFFVASCRQKKSDFSVEAPKGWVKVESIILDSIKQTYLGPNYPNDSSGIKANILIMTYHFSNLDSYFNAAQSGMKRTSPYYQEIERGKFTKDSYEGVWVEQLTSTEKYPSHIVSQKIYYIKAKGNIFMIMCTTNRDGLKLLQPKIAEVLNSFKVL